MSRPSYTLGFESLHFETRDTPLAVQGKLPSWLAGQLLRTGPALFEVGARRVNHWFDGLAMLHKFSVADGQVHYANRYLRSDTYCADTAAERLTRGQFATDPCQTLFGRVKSFFRAGPPTDNANVNVTIVDERIVAVTETPMPVIFDPETLVTEGHVQFADAVRGMQTPAHPHFEHDGTLYSFLLYFGARSCYRLYRMRPGSRQREVIAEIPVARPSYVHSFGMTEHYLVLARFPLVVTPVRLKLAPRPFIQNFVWQPERALVFDVVHKHSGERVASMAAEPGFAFHHVNACERGGRLEVDIAIFDDAHIIDSLYLEKLRHGRPTRGAGRLRRYYLPLTARAEPWHEDITSEPFELPRINYRRCNARAYRYAFGVGQTPTGDFVDTLVKVDTRTGAAHRWHENGCYPGEPVFVAAPEASGEDSGVVLSVVLDARSERSFLLALDAQTFTEMARAEVPHHIPFGFHGQFFEAGADRHRHLHR